MKAGIGIAGVAVVGILLVGADTHAELPNESATPGANAGAFTGLAAPPETNLYTGGASTSIEIQVPPGRAGMAPKVTLAYSSAVGASAIGFGWTLPLASVRRTLRNGVPRYDEGDGFVLELPDGSIDLLPIEGTKRFRAEPEESYLRIGFDRSANRWTVIDKTGTSFVFGVSANARRGPDSSRSLGTYAWLLEHTEDARGNTIDYEYLGPAAGRPPAGLPIRIQYGGNSAAGLEHFLEVRFVWQPVGQPRVSYAAGFADWIDHRLVAIETYAADRLVRRYDLSHGVDAVSQTAHLAAVTLTGFAADPSDDVDLPSTVFTYAPAVQTGWATGPESQRSQAALEFEGPGEIRDGGKEVVFDTFDLNGDGVVDYVDTSGETPVVRFGTASGLAAPRPWPWPDSTPWIRRTKDEHLIVEIVDIDGDGLADLIDTRQSQCGTGAWCVYRNLGDGFEPTPQVWEAPANFLDDSVTSGRSQDVTVALLDLTGDGRPDYVDSTAFDTTAPYWRVWRNNGAGFDHPVEFPAPRRAISKNVALSTQTCSLAGVAYGLVDMNGDGLKDYVIADPGRIDTDIELRGEASWEVYLHTGTGFAQTAVPWRSQTPGFLLPRHIDVHQTCAGVPSSLVANLIDMTGDGLADLLSAYDNRDVPFVPALCEDPSCPAPQPWPSRCCDNLVLLVNTGSGFSAPQGWATTEPSWLTRFFDPSIHTPTRREILDFDGDGLVDLLEHTLRLSPSGAILGHTWRVFRHPASPLASYSSTPETVRTRPNLLLSMLNGVGGETHLSYAPVASMPGNRLPFPHWVVIEREVVDTIAGAPPSTTSYIYSGAAYDGRSREFRGFALVWEVDPIGNVTATTFHQDDVRKGLIWGSFLLADPGCQAWNLGDPADPCNPWNHPLRVDRNEWPATGPRLLSSHVSTPYYQGRAIDALAKTLQWQYDDFGNVVRETVSSPSAGSIATESTYLVRIEDRDGLPDIYLVARPLAIVTRDVTALPQLLAEKKLRYRTKHPGLGNVVEASECMRWQSGDACARWATSSYRYDDAGNVVETTSPTKAHTRTAFDADALYPAISIDAGRLVTRTTYDPATGKRTSRIDPDGLESHVAYDGLGRPVRAWDADVAEQAPQVHTRYVAGSPADGPGHIRVDEIGHAPVVTFIDGLGRVFATKTESDTLDGSGVLIARLLRYDAAGNVAEEAMPFEALDADVEHLVATIDDAPGTVRHHYDGQGRLRERVHADGTLARFDSSVPGVRWTIYPNLAGGNYPGMATLELLDGFGRVYRRDTCSASPQGSTPTDCPPGSRISRTTYAFDGLDRAVSAHVEDPEGRVTTSFQIAYDGLGNKASYYSDASGESRYEYDASGRLLATVDAKGQKSTTAYDRQGRIKRQKAGKFKASYRYHHRSPGAGRLALVTSKRSGSGVRKAFEYDARGRIVTETFRIKAVHHPRRQFTFHYTYDEADRRIGVTYPSSTAGVNDTLLTSYTAFGHVDTVSLVTQDGSVPILSRVEYDLLEGIRRVEYGNGVFDLYAYDPPPAERRLRCLRTTTQPTGDACQALPGDFQGLQYEQRDDSGNLLSIVDAVHGESSPLAMTAAYGYDAAGRVTAVRHRGVTVASFDYDGIGNLTNKDGSRITYSALRPNLATTVGQVAIEHDANGNRTRKGPRVYDYDELNRLERVSEDGEAVLVNVFDEGASRVARYDPVADELAYSFGDYFEVRNDALVRRFHANGRVVASDEIPAPSDLRLTGLATDAPQSRRTLRFYHPDHLGSPTVITNGQAQVVEWRRYDAFGALVGVFDADGVPRAAASSPEGFVGKRREETAGLIYFGARFYDPELAAFLMPDPRRQFASPYLYAGGNPLNGRDADGEFFGLIGALLVPALSAAAITSVISGVSTALQGGDFLSGLKAGFKAGLVSVGITTALGGANIAIQLGTVPAVTADAAARALVEVTWRAAYTTVVAYAAAQTAATAGANSDWSAAVGTVGGLYGSFVFDRKILPSVQEALDAQRPTLRLALVAQAHRDVTSQAAVASGYSAAELEEIVEGNVLTDGPAGSFWDNPTSKLTAVLNNQDHFGQATNAEINRLIASIPNASDVAEGTYLQSVGRAIHFTQDKLTLGHMVPGTSLLAGPIGAPMRFVIHQVFGGEIGFRQAQLETTRRILHAAGPPHSRF